MDFKLMKCGCNNSALLTINGVTKEGCGLHLCTEVAEPGQFDLTGRKARCAYGGNEVDSRPNLAFFRARPDKEHDEYYCGCYGWD